MKEYLKIENFGPINEAELNDIRPLTVLIGESGSGKSTVLKVLSLFRWIYKRVNLRSYLQSAGINPTDIEFDIKELLKISGIDEYLKRDTLIIYKRGRYAITMQDGVVDARFVISPKDFCLDKICFISDKRAMIADFIHNRIERRAANYYLQDTIENFIRAYGSLQQLPLDFLGVKFCAEKNKDSSEKLTIKEIEGEDYSIEMKNSSSGIQTVTPLAMIVEYYATRYNPTDSMNTALFKYMANADMLKDFNAAKNVGEIKDRTIHIMVEEPELSLYPESQKSLTDYLVSRCFNTRHSHKMTLMLATHSPYIVNYVNLLIERAERQIKTPYKVRYDDVSVYEIEGGYVTSLKIGGNKKLIDARSLSEPISDIYSEYNRLSAK